MLNLFISLDFRIYLNKLKVTGKEYQRLIINVFSEESNVIDVIYSVFELFISDEISDFNSSVYYNSPEYLKSSYLEGKLLA